MFRNFINGLKSRLTNDTANTSAPAQAVPAPAANKEEKPSVDTTQAIARGVVSGFAGPLGVMPFDKVATILQSDPTKRMTDVRATFKPTTLLRDTYRGYGFVSVANSIRYTSSFFVGPLIKAELSKLGYDESRSKVVGLVAAGALDGALSAFPNVIKQDIFNKNLTATESLQANLKDKPTFLKKMATSAVFVTPRNAIYWPTFNLISPYFENALQLDKVQNKPLKVAGQFISGAAAGSIANFATTPFDALQRFKLDALDKKKEVDKQAKPKETHKQIKPTIRGLFKEAYKKDGWKAAYKVPFRAGGLAFFKTPVSAGIAFVAIRTADAMVENARALKSG